MVDLTDSRSVAEALHGAAAAYLLSPKDVAGVLAERLGHPIRVQSIPLGAVGPSVIAALGASESTARLYTEMVSTLIAGGLVYEGAGHRFVRGDEPLGDAIARLIPVAA